MEADLDLSNTASSTYRDLDGKHVIVTGGGGGIGASIVGHFAQQGARVSFCDINEMGGEAVVKATLSETGQEPYFSEVNLHNASEIEAWFADAVTKNGRPHCLINNAGNDHAIPIKDITPADLDAVFSSNLKHQLLLCQKAAEAMHDGTIINLGSIVWRIGVANVAAYCAMKAAVEGMTKSLARELGQSGIRVNAIAPGWVLTARQKMKGEANPKKFADYLQRQSLKEHLRPNDVAKVALWLASDQTRLMTGQTITIDGGIV